MGSQTCRPRQPHPLSDDQGASLGLEDARTQERKFTQKYPQFTRTTAAYRSSPHFEVSAFRSLKTHPPFFPLKILCLLVPLFLTQKYLLRR